jgi:hypothetical protein
MSRTLTTEVPAGTINPIMGHVNDDDAALFRAIGPDQPDPPSIGGTDRTTHVPFGWIRPQAGGVTCRWHVRLDVSWVGSVANSAKVTVLRSDPEPLLS